MVETKVRSGNLTATITSCFPAHWLSVHNLSVGPVARIILGWNPYVFTSYVCYTSDQLIVSKFETLDGKVVFFLSVVYGHNSSIDRRRLWDEMRQVAAIVGNMPWVQMGDFNAVRSASERLIGFDSAAAAEFNKCLCDILQDDMPAKGFWFTWTNKRGGAGDNKSRIDRVITNTEWLASFSQCEANFLAPSVSDHCPMMVSVVLGTQMKRSFKFFNFWMQHPGFRDTLIESWNEVVLGKPMFILSSKLKRLKGVLKKLNLHYYSNISMKVSAAKEELDRIQSQYFQAPFDLVLCNTEKEVLAKYVELRLAEESFFKQKARVKWLALGDQNTRFFHQKLCSHRVRNTILSLIEDPEAVKNEILGYYVKLLGSPFEGRIDATVLLDQAIQSKVPAQFHGQLIAPVSATEIKAALMSIHGDKASGPDGYNSNFFQKNWDVVGEDFVRAVSSFFQTGVLLKQWNATAISLIPKVSAPSSIRDFRPISCCNVIYKCITKVLATRMPCVLPSIIDQAQSAFLKGRSIADNVLLMQELVRGYHRDGGFPRCAIKIDLMKAYDSVDWTFLFDCMICMDFPPLFVRWVRECVCSAKYSVILNGSMEGYFPGRRGLRQGDPISPYLFLIVMEAFAAILKYRILHGKFSYHPKCRALNLCHLAFADDLFILSGVDQNSFGLIHSVLQDFHSFSGLQPNISKSAIFYAGVNAQLKNQMESILPFPEGCFPIKYLGVPLISTQLKALDCGALKDKILHRVNDWSNKSLSYGGRALLIQSVLYNVQVYWSSIFILPSKVVKEIESSLMAFLWSGSELNHSRAKVNWEHICCPKEEGGLGFRRVKDWNRATMLRHLWALCKKADTLWVKWVHTYIIKDNCFWTMDIPHDASWTMRKILGIRPLGQPLIKYQIGNGHTTILWPENWHPLGPLYARFGERVVANRGRALMAKVASIIVQGAWCWPRTRNLAIQSILAESPPDLIPMPHMADSVRWMAHPSGIYTAASAWNAIRQRFPVVPWWKIAWGTNHVPRWSFIFWLAAQFRLNTRDRLRSWGMLVDDSCCLCSSGIESHHHLFFECPFSLTVWKALMLKKPGPKDV